MPNKVGGFITLHRQILNWEWYRDTNTFRLFLHILLTANFTEGRFEGRTIHRGQLVTSLTSLAEQTALSVRQVRVSLEHLLMTGEVTSESSNRYRVITVVKYDEYQKRDKQSDKQMTDETAGKRQADDKQMTGSVTSKRQQYNNDNNVINNGTMEQGNNDIISRPAETFDLFWSAYPKKKGKEGARKAFAKINPDSNLLNAMLKAIETQKETSQWKERNGQFIPYPATWLNDHRWEDEIQQENPAPAPSPVPVRKIAAQQYDQRDYGEEDDAAWKRMLGGM